MIEQRLMALREEMARAGIDALIIPRADEYLGEYLPPHNERLRWATGFTGSAGVAIILGERAAIFVDGRYRVQVRRQVPAELFEYYHLLEEPHVDWLVSVLAAGARVGCDPRLHSANWFGTARETLAAADIELQSSVDNLVDRCWSDRPPAKIEPALLLGLEYTGESSRDKRQRIGDLVAAAGAEAALIFAPDSVSWLLNIRGTDVPMMPVLQSFAVLSVDGTMTVLTEPGRVPEGFAQHVGEGVTVLPESGAESFLSVFGGCRVLVDPQGVNAWSREVLVDSGTILVTGMDPVVLPKAAKNSVEVEGARRAHARDALAEVRFLAWLDREVAAGRLHDEAHLANVLFDFRARGEHFHGGSFDTISAAGSNAAMCHYNHLDADQPGNLEDGGVYLVDSGGQYTDGTTDITRTVAIGDPGDEVRRLYTLVLKGHIALDQARFPAGTTGTHLDALARQFLWQEGFDYDHGTGHGVGSFLSVHESPQRIARAWNSAALVPGMIVSNEPGYYRDGAFGIRCENLQVVTEAQACAGEIPMLEFSVLTLVPFDNRLLLPELLTPQECRWLDAYHERVRTTLSPQLDGDDLAWLEQVTQPVKSGRIAA